MCPAVPLPNSTPLMIRMVLIMWRRPSGLWQQWHPRIVWWISIGWLERASIIEWGTWQAPWVSYSRLRGHMLAQSRSLAATLHIRLIWQIFASRKYIARVLRRKMVCGSTGGYTCPKPSCDWPWLWPWPCAWPWPCKDPLGREVEGMNREDWEGWIWTFADSKVSSCLGVRFCTCPLYWKNKRKIIEYWYIYYLRIYYD